jgi:hypothetical protein
MPYFIDHNSHCGYDKTAGGGVFSTSPRLTKNATGGRNNG